MKKIVLKICAMLMVLIMTISSEASYVFAAENEVKEDLATDDLVTDDSTIEDLMTEDLTVEDLAIEDSTTGDLAIEDSTTEDLAIEDSTTGDLATEDLTVEQIWLEDLTDEDFAVENFAVEDLTAGDMELIIPDDEMTALEKELTVEELAVTITEEEPVIFGGGEAQIAALSDETEVDSFLYNWTASGCLTETGDYALYAAELPAGSYLQARLTVPNNSEIDYDLVLYDSELSVIKVSDYLTYLNGTGALAESIGYMAASDEKVYIGVFSTLGGSDTEEYILECSIVTNYSEDREPNENAKEAVALDLGKAGADISGTLNSAIDNDWYSFTVLDSTSYDKIRLSMDFVSTNNGYNIEIYRNIASNYYAMQLIALGMGGEIELPAGTYFLRVISTNTPSNFDAGDLPIYKLSVAPVALFNRVEITKFSGKNATIVDGYPQGKYYRIDQILGEPNPVTITGWAYYENSIGNKYPAQNVRVNAVIIDKQWEAINRPDMSTVYGSAITGENGFFKMTVYLNTALGGLKYKALVSTHYYDLMEVILAAADNSAINYRDYFYYLKLSDRN